jgi:teichuronic acid biosynthesis glycosyltransferase TuaC
MGRQQLWGFALRIAIVATSYPRREGDAAGHFVQTEARALARAGSLVTVIVPGQRRPCPRPDTNPKVLWLPDAGAFGWPGALERLKWRPDRIWGASRFCWAARRLLDKLGPFDRVVAHWIVPSGWPIAAAKPGHVEIVVHGSDVQLLVRLPALLRRRIVGRLLDGGASFRFVSNELRTLLAAATFPELVHVGRIEPCPIDIDAVPSRLRARNELGLDPDEVWIVVVGRMVAGKRPGVALNAATLVPGARVAAVGDGPERVRLMSEHGSVRFLGQLPRRQTLAWITAADLLVTASRTEGSPMVVREARALGVPVVAAGCGDLRRWAEDDPELYVVESRSR